MTRHAAFCLASALFCACASRATPVLDPSSLAGPRPDNVSLLIAAPLTRGVPVTAVLPCNDRLYYRLDGLADGQHLTARLSVEASGTYRFCHQASFPDAHDGYTYTDLRGCATPDAPTHATAEVIVEGTMTYVRVWRDGPAADAACTPARMHLTVE